MQRKKKVFPGRSSNVFDGEVLEEENHLLNKDTEILGSCPKCEKGSIIISQKAYGCSRWEEGCDFVIWKVIACKAVPKTQAKKLVRMGESDLIKGFKSKSGNKFDTVLKLDDQFKVVFSFPEKEPEPKEKPVALGSCPKCSEGEIIEGKKAFGCDRWREGCKFVIWKEIAQKAISREIAEELLINGQTGLLDGFKSRKGEPFSTCLIFDRTHKVVFGKFGDHL